MSAWRLGPVKGPFKLNLSGDWSVGILPQARIKTLKKDLEPLLQEMERRGISFFHINDPFKKIDESLFEKFESLKIADAFRNPRGGSGRVSLGMLGKLAVDGIVDNRYGRDVSEWVSGFLSGSECRDVLYKLRLSNALHRHAFLTVVFDGAPASVLAYLYGSLDCFPEPSPDLPPEVTEVWITSDTGDYGLRWDGRTWRRFGTPELSMFFPEGHHK